MKNIKDYIRTIPDFPQPGVQFRDITTIIQNADGLKLAVDTMCDLVKDLDFDVICGAESRGFIFGAPMAYNLHKPFVLIRKKGKLPGKTISQSYDLEYGSTEIEMHVDSFEKGSKVLIVDDLIATGGTSKAICELVEEIGAEVVSMNFVIELTALNGREILKDYNVQSLIAY